MKKVTVIGTGFAALTAVRTLRRQDQDVEITVVAPKPALYYWPSLIWIPSGKRKGEDIIVPLENFFRRENAKYVQAEATGLEDGGRTLLTSAGPIANDGLIIGSGGRFIKKLPGIEHAITPCEGIPAAEKIRDRLREMQGGTIAVGFAGNPKEPSAMRGGPMFEFLFGIDRQLRREKRRDKFKLVFFSPAPEPGKRMGPEAMRGLLDRMRELNIDIHIGHKMKGFEAGKVITEGGEFPANLILFMPGMTGNQWFDNTELARSEGGLLKADKECRVEGADKVYVAGDSGSFPGPEWLPKQAHMADMQAEAAATNLLAEFRGEEPEATFTIELVCIVDALDSGMMVKRTEAGPSVLPRSPLFAWAKTAFEWWYLRKYR